MLSCIGRANKGNIMGHYDLYGNSYRTATEAMNAEMAQCAEIDARLADERISKLESQQRNEYQSEQWIEYERDQKIDYLMGEVEYLRKKVDELEKRVGHEA